ncbi:MAG TPA: BlaI/MecI/CopY family transcriptional regulator [Gemmatimonadaceae bacterium]|nr:BlaI/MecI/CopY family transcriptional regulator [Gemmatimonadaceae bacterium]
MPTGNPIPSPSELEILDILWRKGPQTVREVYAGLKRKRDIGYTTILKTMQVMAEKGLLTRDESERSHVYAAAAPEKSIKRRLVSDLLDRVFDGSSANLVLQALSAKRASPEDIRKIRKLLNEQSAEEK